MKKYLIGVVCVVSGFSLALAASAQNDWPYAGADFMMHDTDSVGGHASSESDNAAEQDYYEVEGQTNSAYALSRRPSPAYGQGIITEEYLVRRSNLRGGFYSKRVEKVNGAKITTVQSRKTKYIRIEP